MLTDDYLRKRYRIDLSYFHSRVRDSSVVGECFAKRLPADRLELVLRLGANPNLPTKPISPPGDAWLPIEKAIQWKQPRAARVLVQHGASRNMLLLKSAAAGWLEGVKVAVEEGAPLGRLDQAGRTALHHIVGFKFEPGFICPRRPRIKTPENPTEIIELTKLLVQKTPLYQPDHYGFTVYHYAQLASKLFSELAELDKVIPPSSAIKVKGYKICKKCQQILDSEMEKAEYKNCSPGYYRPIATHTAQDHQLVEFIGQTKTKLEIQEIAKNSLLYVGNLK